MTSLQIVYLILLANASVSVIGLFVALVRKSAALMLTSLVVFFAPPVGLLYFAGGLTTWLLLKKDKGMQLEDITFSKSRHNRTIRPDVELESQAVPFEEVLLVSADTDKRKYLLSQLKKDHIDHYGAIKKALDNDDPETSHYAASALTNAKSDFENTLRDFDGQYAKKREDLKLVRSYADFVVGYLSSGIMDPLEERKYSYLLINILTSVENPEQFLTEQDFGHIVDKAIYIENFALAEKWAEIAQKVYANESTYLNLLKVYFYTNQSERFFHTLDDLKRSDLPLSEEGLMLVRYFAGKKRG